MTFLRSIRDRAAALAVSTLIAIALFAPLKARADELVVFAAASMKEAIEEAASKFSQETGSTATVSLAGSSALARQIQQGAPADIFISANVSWMDTLEADGLIDPASRFDLLNNSLVLVAHGKDADPVDIVPGMDLVGILGDGRLAMALVDAVPAGIYGKAALENLGIWEEVAPKVAQADNVRAALALVSAGETPMGIVYMTDAIADENVSVAGTFPAGTHPPIVYPAAAVAESDNPLKARFLEYLKGPVARTAFESRGFVVVAE